MAQIQVIQVCHLCDSQENVYSYCTNCDEILCDNCKKIHLRMKKHKNDNVIPIQEAKNNPKSVVTMCSYHPCEECKFCCHDCQEPICAICYHDEHQTHQWTLLEKYTNSKRESLLGILNELKLVDPICSEAAKTEGTRHGSVTKSVDEAKRKIDNQESTAKEKITEKCNGYRLVLTAIKESENKRHQSACTEIQSQNKKIQTTIHRTETIYDHGDVFQILQAEDKAKQILEETKKKYQLSKLQKPSFQPGDITDGIIMNLIGVLHIDIEDIVDQSKQSDGYEQPENYGTGPEPRDQDKGAGPRDLETYTEQQIRPTDQGARPKHSTEDKDETNGQNQESRKKKTHTQDPDLSGGNQNRAMEHRIGLIQVENKQDIITVIVPVDINRIWVSQHGDRYLTMINRHGNVIKKTVKITEGFNILDAKLYCSDLLVTCYRGQKVIRISKDGTETSTFSDVAPYYTRGLCVGLCHEVLVICLKFTLDWITESCKVLRLNTSGSVVQTIEHDRKGSPLFSAPYRLTSLTSGDIVITDEYKVIAVNGDGKHSFTWSGEKKGGKGDNQSLTCITHDKHNNIFVADYYNDKVYVLNSTGQRIKKALVSKQGMSRPFGIARNHDGQLLVGYNGGKIEVLYK